MLIISKRQRNLLAYNSIFGTHYNSMKVVRGFISELGDVNLYLDVSLYWQEEKQYK